MDIEALLRTLGYAGMAVVIFVETGLFIGFFLPGDSLLITAGLLAGSGHFSLAVLIPLLTVAAIAGDALGYAIGRQAGPRLFAREDARFFRRRHLERARAFYARHGGKTVALARFMWAVRAFAPAVAGATGMPYRHFVVYNALGGLAWVVSLTLLGYTVGNAVPNLDLILVGVVIVASMAPAAWHLWRARR